MEVGRKCSVLDVFWNKSVRRYRIVLHLPKIGAHILHKHKLTHTQIQCVLLFYAYRDLDISTFLNRSVFICELCVCDVGMDAKQAHTHTKCTKEKIKYWAYALSFVFFLPLRLYGHNGWARLGLMERIRRQACWISNKMFCSRSHFFSSPFFLPFILRLMTNSVG